MSGLSSYYKGLNAEAQAIEYFKTKSACLLESRWRCQAGEIDLILLMGKTIVFVEVKQRKSLDIAGEALSIKQQSRICNAANIFIELHTEYQNIDARIDVILIDQSEKLLHLENAIECAHN